MGRVPELLFTGVYHDNNNNKEGRPTGCDEQARSTHSQRYGAEKSNIITRQPINKRIDHLQEQINKQADIKQQRCLEAVDREE
ncbi:hypothetical protein Pmani_004570 [Petrolisthes manimaculis]|uniref:Uncharacterized protein n=1 Tax=Petrolisthes manimaculis TaxID=1843537 RepID=A0AAE1UNW3_9EUCA|nr:hypothetical protein Pmani_004570 [Petrolisthes manimaculis]